MINYREIFNVRYGIFFFGLIFCLFVLLFVVNGNIRTNFKIVGEVLFYSGVVSLIMVFLFRAVINMLVGNVYMVFVSVISDTLYRNLVYRGGINVILGVILKIIYVFILKEKINS